MALNRKPAHGGQRKGGGSVAPEAPAAAAVRALLFDVFGTCVDWRTSIIAAGEAFGRAHGLRGVDWARFAGAWRGRYQPQMEMVRTGGRP